MKKYILKLSVFLLLFSSLVSALSVNHILNFESEVEIFVEKDNYTEETITVRKAAFHSPQTFGFFALIIGTMKGKYKIGRWVAQRLHKKYIFTKEDYRMSRVGYFVSFVGALGLPFAVGFDDEMYNRSDSHDWIFEGIIQYLLDAF